MQALAVITAALASGTAAGVLTYLLFPNGKPGKTADVDRADRAADRNKADHRQSY